MLWAVAAPNHKGGGTSKTLVGTLVNDIRSMKSFEGEGLAFNTSYILQYLYKSPFTVLCIILLEYFSSLFQLMSAEVSFKIRCKSNENLS